MPDSSNQIDPLCGAEMKLSELVKHYTHNELPRKAHSTQGVYGAYLKTWIVPAWGNHKLSAVKPVAVESWLATLPLENSSRAKVRNIMSAIFTHARRWELTDRNPITLVRQSAKRSKTPDVLTTNEVTALLKELPEPALTAVFVAIATGLRVSELLALRWSDVDFDTQTITPRRGIVHQHIGGLKTEESGKPVPASEVVTDALKAWRKISLYPNQTDYIFPSPTMGGQQPFWPCSMLRKIIRPAAIRAKITKRIGWHTLRRTLATLLVGQGTSVKLTQEMLRHANSRITLELYAQSNMAAKLEAQRVLLKDMVGTWGLEPQTSTVSR
jgi:integrase